MPSLPCVVAFSLVDSKTFGPLALRSSPFYLVHPFHPATVRRRSIPHCAASDDAAARGPWFPVVPTCDNGSHAAGSVLRPLPRGRPRHFPSVPGVFFMRLLPFGIGLRNRRTRLA